MQFSVYLIFISYFVINFNTTFTFKESQQKKTFLLLISGDREAMVETIWFHHITNQNSDICEHKWVKNLVHM